MTASPAHSEAPPPSLPAPLAALLAGSSGAAPGTSAVIPPFALLSREGSDRLDLIRGDLVTVATLADIPLPEQAGPQALALVPYRQIVERGFACVDDDTPLECLRISEHRLLDRAEVLAALPETPIETSDGGFDLSDEEYGEIVGRVLKEEIGHGEGANFVIHRTYTAQLGGDPLTAAAAALRRLLIRERGAYWTFLVYTGTRILVGATPERHVSVDDGLVMMNPISGTFRHSPDGADREELLAFLADPKEINELYMVLDEELKMMATVADRGGQVIGPHLKEMAHLIHTEYLLAGRGSRDVREVLRETMFAPTVTGSPIENAFRVIARHEQRGRRYYAGVLALLGHDHAGRQTLDAPILIRSAEIDLHGRLRVPVGATLVRDSTAAGEVAETHTKAAGVLAALGIVTRPEAAAGETAAGGAAATVTSSDRPAAATVARLADDIQVQAALAARNRHLAPFWLQDHSTEHGTEHGTVAGPTPAAPPLRGSVLVVDAEDTFTGMLVHQLRALGLTPTVVPWQDFAGAGGDNAPDRTALDLTAPGRTAPGLTAPDLTAYDLVIPGPGPGDPTDPSDPKMATLRRLIRRLLDQRRPTLGVCLSHQILSARLGLTLFRREEPYQGLQRRIEFFGRPHRVAYYASFTALASSDRFATPYGPVEVCRDPAERTVHALRGETFAGVQFHPESVLTEHGLEILTELISPLVADHVRSPA